MIIIKVFVPATDDTWKVCVPEDITLRRFTSKVLSKLGFHVAFSGGCFDGTEYYFRTDDVFRCWVSKRVRHGGRNLPIAAHVIDPPAPSRTRTEDARLSVVVRKPIDQGKPGSAGRLVPLFRYRDSLDILLGRISDMILSPIGRYHRWRMSRALTSFTDRFLMFCFCSVNSSL
ncbi:hypothetical protein PISMIDRAFT_686558 [Pisolithus microcarpus 441]|uniref:Uncharacterized protein n=1 Tax=Pisolithus microcarpus 441 TaxID=765257 RepID=A0A0C9YQS5_9AGAM|nr:hypothetical protein BKA83DRAFT_686558 [Pisolithus microcarpus]KIK16164.1 hypothetical protein PISMIDRAFT_686558 [Pisolithus microcarpus 441]